MISGPSRYVCLECGYLFKEPKRFTERHGLDSPPYEDWLGCPACGGDFAPIVRCDGCGDVITGTYVLISPTGERYCENCYKCKEI